MPDNNSNEPAVALNDHASSKSNGATEQVIYSVPKAKLPKALQSIQSPPKQLYIRAANSQVFDELLKRPRVAIVGSRDVTLYGEYTTKKFASELAAHGIVIISGLALGVDALAHRTALDVGGLTMAVLPSSVTQVLPKANLELANEIIAKGGALVSEYPLDAVTFKPNFVARNRIVAGLSNILLITEAAADSGSLHTASFAKDHIDVMAVPGNINTPNSVGANRLLKDGATPATEIRDVLYLLNMEPASRGGKIRAVGGNEQEQAILDLLEQGIYSGSELLKQTGFTIQLFNQTLTMLEISAKIRPLGGNQWALQ